MAASRSLRPDRWRSKSAPLSNTTIKTTSSNTMKFPAPILLSAPWAARGFADTATATDAALSRSAGGAGVHVPVGKDGEGEYTASTKGW